MCFLDVKVQFLFFPKIHSNSEWKGVNQNRHWKSKKMNTRGSENEDAEFSLPLKGSLFWACHLLHLLQGHFPRLLWLHTTPGNFWALLLPHRNGIYLIFDFNYWHDTSEFSVFGCWDRSGWDPSSSFIYGMKSGMVTNTQYIRPISLQRWWEE